MLIVAHQAVALAADPWESVSKGEQQTSSSSTASAPAHKMTLGPWPADKPLAHDSVRILSSGWEGGQLWIRLGFGGGCAAHDFGYLWSPEHERLTIVHDAHHDGCEAYLSRLFVVEPLPPVDRGSSFTVIPLEK